ncbi:MAG: outer membrane lipoprotein-sorting protein [Nitrospinae bacterium]|nr:outer membrane lipoprotein-sorting protein [Nitrospinota bacterium]
MFRKLILSILLLAAAAQARADDGISAILREADMFRLPVKSSRLDVGVTVMVDGKEDKVSKYRVYASPGRKSLILFRSAGELGQKALQLDEKFYLLMPRSQLPVRISPMQKLLGDAAVGDISTMTWSEDYTGSVENKNVDAGGQRCLMLRLTAAREGTTYGQVELYVTKDRHFPVKASLYLASGRLAKEVEFHEGRIGEYTMVSSMTMRDRIQKNRVTEVTYSALKPISVPDNYFNPAYLTRNNVE